MAGVQFNPAASQFGAGGSAPAVPQTGLQVVGGGSTGGVTTAKEFYGDTGMTMPGVMPEFLNDIFKQPLEDAKRAREWQGFSDAVNGATVEEVRKNGSWYTKIFGPTHYEQGMMMYQMQDQQSKLQADFMRRMPELRKMSSDDVSTELNGMMQGMMTGDPFVDAVVQKSSMEAFAPLMNQHTKERVAWQNTEMLKQQQGAWDSAADAHQLIQRRNAMLGGSGPMQKEYAEQLDLSRQSLLDRLQVGQYQTDDSVKAFVNTALRSAIRKGNFYAVEVAIDAGVLDAMSPSDAESFQKAYITGMAQYKNRFAEDVPEFGKEITMLGIAKGAGVGGKDIEARVDRINDAWSAMTGSKAPYYDLDQKASLMADGASSWLRRYERAEDRANSLRDRLAERQLDTQAKEEAEVRNTARLTDAFQNGSLGQLINLKGVEKSDADRASSAYFMQRVQENPAQAVGFLIWNQNNLNGSYVNDHLSKQLQDNVQLTLDADAPANDAFMAQFGIWQTMFHGKGFAVRDGTVTEGQSSQGRATAFKYYGDEITNKMIEFERKLSAGVEQARAFDTTFGRNAEGGRPDFRATTTAQTKDRQAAFLSALDKMDAGLWERTFGNGFKLHPSARAQLARDASANYERIDGSGYGDGNEGLQAQDATNMTVGRNAEIVGPYYLTNGRNQQTLSTWMGDTPDRETTSVLFNMAMEAKMKEAGTSSKGFVYPARLQDDNGEPVFAVTVTNEEGTKILEVRGSDLKAIETQQRNDVQAAINLARQSRRETREGTVVKTDTGIPLGFKVPDPVDESGDDAYTRESKRAAKERSEFFQRLNPFN